MDSDHKIKDQMNRIYGSIPADKIPWNREEPPEILRNLVETGQIEPCKTVDLGCGAGNYAIYLAKNGFDVTGVDISELAIEMANLLSSEQNVDCSFIAADLRKANHGVSGSFDFAYDWEVMHHIFPKDREAYINNVYNLLNPGAHYLSVCFSEKSPQFGGMGKYRKTPLDTVLYFSSETELVKLFEPFFEIKELKTVDVEGKFGTHKAVFSFLKKINSDYL